MATKLNHTTLNVSCRISRVCILCGPGGAWRATAATVAGPGPRGVIWSVESGGISEGERGRGEWIVCIVT